MMKNREACRADAQCSAGVSRPAGQSAEPRRDGCTARSARRSHSHRVSTQAASAAAFQAASRSHQLPVTSRLQPLPGKHGPIQGPQPSGMEPHSSAMRSLGQCRGPAAPLQGKAMLMSLAARRSKGLTQMLGMVAWLEAAASSPAMGIMRRSMVALGSHRAVWDAQGSGAWQASAGMSTA